MSNLDELTIFTDVKGEIRSNEHNTQLLTDVFWTRAQ